MNINEFEIAMEDVTKEKIKTTAIKIGKSVAQMPKSFVEGAIYSISEPIRVFTGCVFFAKEYKNAKKNNDLYLNNFRSIKIYPKPGKINDEYKQKSAYFKSIDKKKDLKNETAYVWWDEDNNIVAVAALNYQKYDKYKWITALEINPKYKGRGLDGQLINYVSRYLGGNAIAIPIKDKNAIKFCESHGFKISNQNKDHDSSNASGKCFMFRNPPIYEY